VSPTRSLARPLMAAMFVTGGVDALRNPDGRVDAARAAGLSEPEKLVRANAATQLVGGLALASGKLPRLAALALAGSLVPTTVVGHPFWQESDPQAKKNQQIQFFKNLSMLGGLLLAAADTGGRESLPHAAARVTKRAQKKASKTAHKLEKKAEKLEKKAEKRLHAA
jgi:putative oxidoreductase